jgi:hypothetical protein
MKKWKGRFTKKNYIDAIEARHIIKTYEKETPKLHGEYFRNVTNFLINNFRMKGINLEKKKILKKVI